MPEILSALATEADSSELACAFCQEPNYYSESLNGLACDDCFNQVVWHCDTCGEAVLQNRSYYFLARAFAAAVAELWPRFGNPSRDSGLPENYAIPPRSFLASAFGLSEVPRTMATVRDTEEQVVCQDCAVACSNCLELYYYEESALDCCPEYSCSDCGDRFEEADEAYRCCSGLRSYCYRPSFTFAQLEGSEVVRLLRSRAGIPYLGIELELENALAGMDRFLQDAGEDASSEPTFLYLKEDGSLGSEGAEIVTMPSTFDAFRQSFPFRALDRWRENGARSYGYESCGLHIHISRSAFDAPHLWRFTKWQLKNQEYCQTVAQRSDSNYAQWTEGGRLEERACSLPEIIKGKDSNRSRYIAINFQNAKTVELRYFKGNLTEESILAKVGFVDALYFFTKSLTYQDCAQGALNGPGRFLAFLRLPESQERYSALNNFMIKRGF